MIANRTLVGREIVKEACVEAKELLKARFKSVTSLPHLDKVSDNINGRIRRDKLTDAGIVGSSLTCHKKHFPQQSFWWTSEVIMNVPDLAPQTNNDALRRVHDQNALQLYLQLSSWRRQTGLKSIIVLDYGILLVIELCRAQTLSLRNSRIQRWNE